MTEVEQINIQPSLGGFGECVRFLLSLYKSEDVLRVLSGTVGLILCLARVFCVNPRFGGNM